MANIRIKRINSTMQNTLAQIIRDELKDSRLQGAIVSVLKVDVSNDLSHAKINVSIFSKNKQDAFNAILSSVPYLRKTLARKMQLRHMPQLHFILDDSLEYAEKMNNLFSKIKNDENKK